MYISQRKIKAGLLPVLAVRGCAGGEEVRRDSFHLVCLRPLWDRHSYLPSDRQVIKGKPGWNMIPLKKNLPPNY